MRPRGPEAEYPCAIFYPKAGGLWGKISSRRGSSIEVNTQGYHGCGMSAPPSDALAQSGASCGTARSRFEALIPAPMIQLPALVSRRYPTSEQYLGAPDRFHVPLIRDCGRSPEEGSARKNAAVSRQFCGAQGCCDEVETV